MKPKNDLEDRLDPLEPRYQSGAETRIGRLLDEHGLLFYYRQPRLILTEGRYEMWHPAFTLPYHNSLVIEYAGPLDTPEQRAELVRRQQVYADNGIPAIFLEETLQPLLPEGQKHRKPTRYRQVNYKRSPEVQPRP